MKSSGSQVILTRGIATVKSDMAPSEHTLVDTKSTDGTQNIVNLFLAGRAVSDTINGERLVDTTLCKGESLYRSEIEVSGQRGI